MTTTQILCYVALVLGTFMLFRDRGLKIKTDTIIQNDVFEWFDDFINPSLKEILISMLILASIITGFSIETTMPLLVKEIPGADVGSIVGAYLFGQGIPPTVTKLLGKYGDKARKKVRALGHANKQELDELRIAKAD